MVPLAGIEPALLAELDFESSASTSSATRALANAKSCEAGGIIARARPPSTANRPQKTPLAFAGRGCRGDRLRGGGYWTRRAYFTAAWNIAFMAWSMPVELSIWKKKPGLAQAVSAGTMPLAPVLLSGATY